MGYWVMARNGNLRLIGLKCGVREEESPGKQPEYASGLMEMLYSYTLFTEGV